MPHLVWGGGFAEPAFAFGLDDAGFEVVVDLFEPSPAGFVIRYSEHYVGIELLLPDGSLWYHDPFAQSASPPSSSNKAVTGIGWCRSLL
ncbi:hypothetical protein [Nocardia bovistercoris]|uniref:Uncharacterized protein n=1 Tax=Nocardia bovistercoris TaxID=2785916 RepID=A0A931I6Z0_9NOCA|nr:hypothetical protein [Nocardia bovistercoris]MBH0775033.1 hypothetical protein [Nocardia bovistercoris]